MVPASYLYNKANQKHLYQAIITITVPKCQFQWVPQTNKIILMLCKTKENPPFAEEFLSTFKRTKLFWDNFWSPTLTILWVKSINALINFKFNKRMLMRLSKVTSSKKMIKMNLREISRIKLMNLNLKLLNYGPSLILLKTDLLSMRKKWIKKAKYWTILSLKIKKITGEKWMKN